MIRGAVLLLLLLIVVPAPATAQRSAQEQAVVKVGTEGTYPPFSFHDPQTNELTGYDIEVIKAIAAKAGWRLEFVETEWDAIVLDGGVIVESGPPVQAISDPEEERTQRFLHRVLDHGEMIVEG